MHALGRYVLDLMDARGWKQADLVRASGLSRALVSRLLTKDTLGRMVEESTIGGLVRAFPEVGEGAFITKSAEALGVPVDRLVVVEPTLSQISNRTLLDLLEQRLEERNGNEGLAPKAQKSRAGAAASGSDAPVSMQEHRRRRTLEQGQPVERAADSSSGGHDLRSQMDQHDDDPDPDGPEFGA